MEKVIRLALILVVLVICSITFTPNIFARDYADYTGGRVYNPTQTNSSDGPITCQAFFAKFFLPYSFYAHFFVGY